MKTIISLIDNIEDYQIKVTNTSDFYYYIVENSIKAKGFGKDKHSSETNPTYSVYQLSEDIEYNSYLYDTISIDYSTGAVLLQPSYEEACYNASIDGRGEGYSI